MMIFFCIGSKTKKYLFVCDNKCKLFLERRVIARRASKTVCVSWLMLKIRFEIKHLNPFLFEKILYICLSFKCLPYEMPQ